MIKPLPPQISQGSMLITISYRYCSSFASRSPAALRQANRLLSGRSNCKTKISERLAAWAALFADLPTATADQLGQRKQGRSHPPVNNRSVG